MNSHELESKIHDLEQKYWILYNELQQVTRKSWNVAADALEAKTEAGYTNDAASRALVLAEKLHNG
jgi:hypothetical protein